MGVDVFLEHFNKELLVLVYTIIWFAILKKGSDTKVTVSEVEFKSTF